MNRSATVPAAAPQTAAPLSSTARTRLRRESDRAATDRAALVDVLEAGMFCHLGVVVDGSTVVLPTAYGVDLSPEALDAPDGTLYFHGSVAARSIRSAQEQTVCVTITHADGLVLARSGFHHSVNYRSAVIFGQPRLVTDPVEKLRGLNLIIDHLVPGRSERIRPPTRKELAATSLLALPLTEASVKQRTGGPEDDPEDTDLPIWAGVVPLRTVASEAITSSDCPVDDVPEHVRDRVAWLSRAAEGNLGSV
jgi:nitroimidazol reductase NimA-like FMN-containing flavoprotein (pyridoxamine 5'-phosphate oxidase superfamily)